MLFKMGLCYPINSRICGYIWYYIFIKKFVNTIKARRTMNVENQLICWQFNTIWDDISRNTFVAFTIAPGELFMYRNMFTSCLIVCCMPFSDEGNGLSNEVSQDQGTVIYCWSTDACHSVHLLHVMPYGPLPQSTWNMSVRCKRKVCRRSKKK